MNCVGSGCLLNLLWLVELVGSWECLFVGTMFDDVRDRVAMVLRSGRTRSSTARRWGSLLGCSRRILRFTPTTRSVATASSPSRFFQLGLVWSK